MLKRQKRRHSKGQGARSKGQRAGSKGQRAGSKGHGARSKEQGARGKGKLKQPHRGDMYVALQVEMHF